METSNEELFRFINELEKELNKRRRYITMDFILAHLFVWLSVIASFFSAILIAEDTSKPSSISLAIIAGIPGLVVVVEKSFDFAGRYVWGIMYKLEIQDLIDEVKFQHIEIFDATKKLRDIIRRNELGFSKFGFFTKTGK